MQGLFGRFGKKQPEQPAVSATNSRYNGARFETETDDREFPSTNRFDDDEETNWDDAETSTDADNPIVYAQPTVPVVAPLPINTTPDLEEWDEALPAATVKNSNIQEVRRSKTPVPTTPTPQNENVWDDNIPSRNFLSSSGANPAPVKSSQIVDSVALKENRAIGLWTTASQQFRGFLPTPLRRLSEAILIAIVVLLVTISIWIIDGLFVPGIDPAAAKQPTAVLSNPAKTAVTELNGSPEQAFVEAIQGQLRDLTSQYSDDIIQTLRIDVARNLLIVQLNPSWYQITDDKQDRATDQMWIQAKANHFSKLEIQDSQGISIARSPVVGNHPIILQRRKVN